MAVIIKPTKDLLKERHLETGGKAQRYVDSEVVRLSEKYTPFRKGYLKQAIGTVFGSGKVVYNLAYAKWQYYYNAGKGFEGVNSFGGLRGRLWFERMKAVYLEVILDGAAKLSGGRGKDG